jgi:peptidoglycan/xylan/chitin deacetylase (PgdA/CDA1 family)
MKKTTSILSRVGNKIARAKEDLGWQLGMNRSWFKKAKGARILVYHGICRTDPLRFNSLFVTQNTFESHLQFYKKYFNVVSLSDFYGQRYDPDKFTVCLSFDDGFANNYEYALPLLQEYQLPATFFITAIRAEGYDILWNDFLSIVTHYGPHTLEYRNEKYIKTTAGRYVLNTDGKALVDMLRHTGFPAKKEMMNELAPVVDFKSSPQEKDYWCQMTPAQIRELSASPLVTIGCHGYYHNDLAKIPLNLAKEELTDSKKFLEKTIGKEIRALAFPYGSYTQELREYAKQIGFDQLLATDFLFPEDAHDTTLRERLTINPYITVINQMYATVRGHYQQ